ncbi:MAG: ABC transporter ATP-binding protein/permease [Bacteroides sp.]|nr:ABC transporter ATP-binding protein/permease [Eubacterium sp.]MCM1418089.1 ABC transporter ATP-binding protein/permease [Roseburia sp.]MCM1462233.1 ABC transporter ATP-binding protein/permease [Bacteroides sp.]
MLSLKNIKKDYTMGDSTVHALKGVSVDFRESEFVSILGQSGCGKTTMLNIIGGLDRYTDGDLVIDGVSTKKYKDRDWDTYRNHKIGFVFQSYNLIPHQTVLANVELALTLSGVSKTERRKRAVEVLQRVGLGDQLRKKPNQMSGGQMQRVAIARALINDPDILLADEPTGALDSETSVQIMEILREISRDKLIIMVTHNPELAEQYSNRIIRLVDGKITGDTNPFTNEKPQKNAPEKVRKTSMSFLTAMSLSLNNLMTKKGRTILTAFAGSIGIIGIALILSLSNGVQEYIDDIQAETLASYPLVIDNSSTDMMSFMSASVTAQQENRSMERDPNTIYTNNRLGDMFTMMYQETNSNDLKSFKEFLESEEEELSKYCSNIEYSYGITLQVFADDTEEIRQVNPSNVLDEIGFGAMSGMMGLASQMSSSTAGRADIFEELTESEEMFNSKYELAAGKLPESYDEAVLIIDKYNEITDYTLYTLGLRDVTELKNAVRDMIQKKDEDEISELSEGRNYSFDEILGITFRVAPNSALYEKDDDGVWVDMREDSLFMEDVLENSVALKIVGIVRAKEAGTGISGTIGYKKELMEYISAQINDSEIVKEQREREDYDIFTGLPFDGTAAGDEALEKAEAEAEERREEAERLMEQMAQAQENAASAAAGGFDPSALSEEQQAALMAMSEEERAAYLATLQPQSQPDLSLLTEEQRAAFLSLPQDEQEAYLASLGEGAPSEAVDAAVSDGNLDLSSIDLSQLTAEQQQYFMSLSEEERTQLFEMYMKQAAGAGVVSGSTYYDNMNTLGVISLDEPSAISIYPIDFEAKEHITDMIGDYNRRMEDGGEESKVITYTDVVGMMMSSVTDIINAISYILIAFVAISLVVSSIMIGIITYISVLERTKEIGILRSIGASKRDISRVFNAETIIVGLVSGCLGILVTVLLNIPINIIIEEITDISGLSALPPIAGLILIVISVILTLIAGLLPSGVAAKKDPVVALRTE